MKCANCGYIMDVSDTYCGNCGTIASSPDSYSEMQSDKQLLNKKEEISPQQTHIPSPVEAVVSSSQSSRRGIIPFSYGAAMFFFLLPFLDLKCGGTPIVSYTGLDLVVGKDIPGGEMFGDVGEEREVPPNLWAVITLVSCIGGLFVFVTRQENELSTGKILSIIGAISLIILQVTIRNSSRLDSEEMQGAITINFLMGYWGCFLAIVVAGILCHLVLEERK